MYCYWQTVKPLEVCTTTHKSQRRLQRTVGQLKQALVCCYTTSNARSSVTCHAVYQHLHATCYEALCPAEKQHVMQHVLPTWRYVLYSISFSVPLCSRPMCGSALSTSSPAVSRIRMSMLTMKDQEQRPLLWFAIGRSMFPTSDGAREQRCIPAE